MTFMRSLLRKVFAAGVMLGSVGLLAPRLLWARGVLENPQAGSSVSGISLVSGWKCTARTLTVQFDVNPPVLAVYGTSWEDTHSTCGQSHTGFGLLWNYNLLGDGQHTVTVFDNGGSCTLSVRINRRGLSVADTVS